MNLRLNKINWKVLSDASDKLDGELASQPILGLVRAEVLLRGVDELQREAEDTKSTSSSDHSDSKRGSPWPPPAPESSTRWNDARWGRRSRTPPANTTSTDAYWRTRLAAEGDWTGFADGLAEDARAAANAITEEDTKTVKVRYDAAVTAAHFEFIEAEIAAAARVAADARAPATISRRPAALAVDRSGRRAEDRGRGGDGRCGKWHVIRRRPSRGGGGGGGGGHRVDVWQKNPKRRRRERGAGAAAAAAAAGGERCPPWTPC